MEKFYCVRVYPNGEAKHTLRDEAGKDNWLKYNLQSRPGNMLFINGVFMGGGCFKEEHEKKYRDKIEPILLEELPIRLKGEIDTIGPQEDRSMLSYVDRYVGYRPELTRTSFNLRD